MPLPTWTVLSRAQVLTNLTKDSAGIAGLSCAVIDRYWQEREVPIVVQRLLVAWKELEKTAKDCLEKPVMRQFERQYLEELVKKYAEIQESALAVIQSKTDGIIMRFVPQLSKNARAAMQVTQKLLDFKDEITSRSLRAEALYSTWPSDMIASLQGLAAQDRDTTRSAETVNPAATTADQDNDDVGSDIQANLMSVIPVPSDVGTIDDVVVVGSNSHFNSSTLSLYAGSTISTASYAVIGARHADAGCDTGELSSNKISVPVVDSTQAGPRDASQAGRSQAASVGEIAKYPSAPACVAQCSVGQQSPTPLIEGEARGGKRLTLGIVVMSGDPLGADRV